MKIGMGNILKKIFYPQKSEIKESSIKTQTDSYIKSSGGDKELNHASLSNVFFQKGEEVSSKMNLHVIRDIISGKKDNAIYRVDFDCKKDDASFIRKVVPLSDGTFSLIKEKCTMQGDKQIEEYVLVKTDESGHTRKEKQILRRERDKRKEKPSFNFAKDGRFVMEDGKKCRYFSPDGKEIWQKKINSGYPGAVSAFLPDGSAFVATNNKMHDTLCMIGPDGSTKWEKEITSANCSLSTDTSGNLYISDWKGSYLVIHPNGKEEKFTPADEGTKYIEDLSVNERGSVFICMRGEDNEGNYGHDLVVKRKGAKDLKWHAEPDHIIVDYTESDDRSVYIITRKKYYCKMHAIDPDGKAKWEVDLPRTYIPSEHNLTVGKDGNIYVSVNGVGANSNIPLPDSFKNLLPYGKGSGLGKDVQSLLLCLSPNGKLHWLYANKNKAYYWSHESPPTAQANGNVIFTDGSNKHVFIVSKDIDKYKKMNEERMGDIFSESIGEIDDKKTDLVIEKKEKEGIVKIGGVELPINKSILDYDK